MRVIIWHIYHIVVLISPIVAEDCWNVAEIRMYYMIQIAGMEKKEDLWQTEENLSIKKSLSSGLVVTYFFILHCNNSYTGKK